MSFHFNFELEAADESSVSLHPSGTDVTWHVTVGLCRLTQHIIFTSTCLRCDLTLSVFGRSDSSVLSGCRQILLIM